ncbi:hypothetical protein ABPG72_014030 [Tetrahymena utriculariae]
MFNSKNKIKDRGACSIGSNLSNCSKITNLMIDMNENEFGDEGTSLICTGLGNLKNLTNLQLCLQSNKIYDKGAYSLGSYLNNCTILTTLKFILCNSQIGDEGCNEIGLGLRKCQNLTNLEISLCQNNISEKGYLQFDQNLTSLQKLSSLKSWLVKKEKLLKSHDFVNCKNVKVLSIILRQKVPSIGSENKHAKFGIFKVGLGFKVQAQEFQMWETQDTKNEYVLGKTGSDDNTLKMYDILKKIVTNNIII